MLGFDNLTTEQVYDLWVAADEVGDDRMKDAAWAELADRLAVEGPPPTIETTPPLVKLLLPPPFKGQQASGGGEGSRSDQGSCWYVAVFMVLGLLCLFAFLLWSFAKWLGLPY